MVSLKNTTSLMISERELNSKLTKIFTKVGQLENAQQGIQELYELLMEHPECDVRVNAFLASAGTFFQKYIRKALADLTTKEMQKCGMLPTESSNTVSVTKDVTIRKPSTTPKSNKPPHKFTTNRCSNSHMANKESSSSMNKNSTIEIKSPPDSSADAITSMSPTTKAFIDKVSRETFDQTRSRLHAIFQYEKYKTGQKRSSLPELQQIKSDFERLEFVKGVIQSRQRARRSAWIIGDSNAPLLSRFSADASLRTTAFI